MIKMNAIVSAGTVVERKRKDSGDREILMVVRENDLFGIPAGHLENETPVQCARREFREETGYEVILEEVIKIVTIAPEEAEEGPSIGFIFYGQLGEKVAEGELEARWVSEEELSQLLVDGRLFLPHLHAPAFWGRLDRGRTAHISLVTDRILPRKGSLLDITFYATPFPGSI